MRARISLILPIALSAVPLVAEAQIGPLSLAATAAESGAIPSSAQAVTDVFIGRNVVGPYVLSWRGVDSGSDFVSHNGRQLKRGADYSVDAGAGILTFTKPIRNGQMVRIDYRCLPGQSVRNSGSMVAPMQLQLFQSGAMTMNAIFKPGSDKDSRNAAGGPSSLMLLNFGGATQVAGHSKLASRMFFDLQGGAVAQKGALQLSDDTSTGIGLLKASFTRGGRQFKAVEESGIAAGKQVLEAGANFKPVHGVHASASFRQVEDLVEGGKGAVVTTIGQRLAGTLGAVTRFQATRTNTLTETPEGDSVTKVADRIQLDSRLGSSTSATALLEREQVEAGDSGKVAQTGTFSIRSQPTSQLSVQGTFQNKLSAAGAEDVTGLRVEANPSSAVRLSANMGDRFTKERVFRNREAALQFNRGNLISLSGLFRTVDDGKQQTIVRGFTASSRPFGFVEVSGGVRLRETMVDHVIDPSLPDSYNVKVSLRLLNDALKLTGGYIDNPEDDKGVIAQAYSRNIGLESTMGRVTLAGAYGLQDDYLVSKLVTTTELSLGWRFLPASQILTTYKESLAREAGLLDTDTYSLSLTHRVGSAFDFALSGIYTTYEKDGVFLPNKDYRAEARLGIRW